MEVINDIITRMEELKADGIDFMSIKFGDEIPSIFCSYTKEEFRDIKIIPKANYKYWKIVNGKKIYLNIY